MHSTRKNIILIMMILIVFISFIHFEHIYSFLYHTFYNKDGLSIYISFANTQIRSVSSEPSNNVYLKAMVKDSSGKPIPNISIDFINSDGTGDIKPKTSKTNHLGECIATYIPPYYYDIGAGKTSVDITASITGTNKTDRLQVDLVPVPVVFVHGYQEGPGVFDNLNEYLTSKGFSCSSISYDSTQGVESASKDLNVFLHQQKKDFMNMGILVNRFDLITHSMGGLVARYYSGSMDYIKNDDINKIIFLSVPHKGSILASIAEEYFNDRSIKNLMPDDELFTKTFAGMINGGLNKSIQVGNVLSQYDEVVTEENASLEEWGIKTEIFRVGDNSFTVDNLLSGDILHAPNHKGILNNKRVFDRIFEMLNSNLSHPSNVKK
ncbi:MAG: alpha/beta hydrolase [Clostridium sp.]|nr:alpha/beta hydrolase [Clostridium sp.]